MNVLDRYKKKQMSESDKKLVRHQVAIECCDVTKHYELALDISFIYAAVAEFGIGPKRAERLYRKYWEMRDEVQAFVRGDGESMDLEDGLRETMMEQTLLSRGIDVRKWHDNYASKPRLEARIVDK